MKHYLTPLEHEKVVQFNEDATMREAVKKVLLEGLYSVGTLEAGKEADARNWAFNLAGLNDMAMDDATVGNLLKVTAKGIAALEDGFKRVGEFVRLDSDKDNDVNVAH